MLMTVSKIKNNQISHPIFWFAPISKKFVFFANGSLAKKTNKQKKMSFQRETNSKKKSLKMIKCENLENFASIKETK